MAFFKKILKKPVKEDDEPIYGVCGSFGDDLSFGLSEELEILDRSEGGWWKARIKGTDQEGFVPSNFIQVKSPVIKEAGIFISLEYVEGSSSEDLCVEKGTKMEILDASNPIMWKAKVLSTGEFGSIPRNKITEIEQLDNQRWYARNISRNDAENVLKVDGRPGNFLVRDSQNMIGSYALSDPGHNSD